MTNRIERLQRDILWGGVREEFWFQLAKWKQVCSYFQDGLDTLNVSEASQLKRIIEYC